MADSTQPSLESSLQRILTNGLKFRVLTVGKTGAGKTSLIKEAFGITSIQASDKEPGKCDINDELYSDQNKYFVLHDSQGFEPGETDNLIKVRDFLEERMSKISIKDRLHAIWLCIRIPEAGGRVISTGEEELIKFMPSDVPIIVVFTQYDKLHDNISFKLTKNIPSFVRLDRNQQRKEVEDKANSYFKKECVDKLKQLELSGQKLKWIKISTKKEYAHTLVDLTQETETLIKAHLAKEVWVAAATAQRVAVDSNVEASVSVGLDKYWRGLASGTNFSGRPLRDCFDVIHRDIVDVWNFRDTNKLLQKSDFKARILDLIQDLAESNSTSSNEHSNIPAKLDMIKKALDVVAPFGGPIGPIISSLGLSALFAQRLLEIYETTPGVVRALMGYIVDLTLVLEGLFWITSAQPTAREIMEDDLEASIDLYSRSQQYNHVHEEIRSFVDKLGIIDVLKPDESYKEVVRLIKKYRPNFVEETHLNDRSVALEITNTQKTRSPSPSNSSTKQKKKGFFGNLTRIFSRGKK